MEYKRSMSWDDELTRVKLAKAMMAMANLRDGGVIVIGMREIAKGNWAPDSLTEEQLASFKQDEIAQWVNDCATPAVQFSIDPFLDNGNRFAVIQVQEFEADPVICRKQKTGGGESLRQGAIYFRSNRMNESAPVSTDEDMRELISMAIEKGISRHISRLDRLQLISVGERKPADAELYERERAGL